VKLAAILVLLIACGSPARESTTIAQTAPDDRLIVQRFEIRGVLDGRAAELRELVRADIAPGVELTDQRYDAAHKAIENDYHERGHVAVKLAWPDFQTIKGPFALVLTITEGPRFTLRSLDVDGVPANDRARYLALATIKPGDYFAPSKLRAWREAVLDAAPGSIVEPEVTLDPVAATIAFTLHVKN